MIHSIQHLVTQASVSFQEKLYDKLSNKVTLIAAALFAMLATAYVAYLYFNRKIQATEVKRGDTVADIREGILAENKKVIFCADGLDLEQLEMVEKLMTKLYGDFFDACSIHEPTYCDILTRFSELSRGFAVKLKIYRSDDPAVAKLPSEFKDTGCHFHAYQNDANKEICELALDIKYVSTFDPSDKDKSDEMMKAVAKQMRKAATHISKKSA